MAETNATYGERMAQMDAYTAEIPFPRGVPLASPIHPHTALENALSWAYRAEGYDRQDDRVMAAQMAQMWAGIASAAIAWERA